MMLFTVQPLKRSQKAIPICSRACVPMCNVSFMHELKTLIKNPSKLIGDDDIWENSPHKLA